VNLNVYAHRPSDLFKCVLVTYLGRRVEIVEDSTGPVRVSHHLRCYVPDIDEFRLDLRCTKRSESPVQSLLRSVKRRVQTALSKADPSSADDAHVWHWHLTTIRREDGFNFYGIHRWSADDLLTESQATPGGAPRPQ